MTEDYQIDVNHVQSMFEDELDGIDLHVREREIGNGPQFALEGYKEGTTTQVYESYWYDKDEFEAFCSGLKALGTLFRKAAKERTDD